MLNHFLRNRQTAYYRHQLDTDIMTMPDTQVKKNTFNEYIFTSVAPDIAKCLDSALCAKLIGQELTILEEIMDLQLSSTQKDYQLLAREFTAREIKPQASHYDRSASFAIEIYQKAWEAGMLNLAVPEALGGLGLSIWNASLIAEELAYGCAGIAGAIEFSLIAQLPLILGSAIEMQQEFLLPLSKAPQFAGIDLFSFLAPAKSALSIKRQGADYVLNGTCSLVLNPTRASWILVTLPSSTSSEKSSTHLVIPTNLSQNAKKGERLFSLGRKAADMARVSFIDAVVPGNYCFTLSHQIWCNAVAGMHILIAAGMVGVAQCAFDHALNYAGQRTAFGKAIVEHEAVGFMLADMVKNISAARLLTWQAAAPTEDHVAALQQARIAHAFAADNIMQTTLNAVQILGGYGYSQEYPVEKLLRDAQTYQAMTVSSHLLKADIACGLLLSNRAVLSS